MTRVGYSNRINDLIFFWARGALEFAVLSSGFMVDIKAAVANAIEFARSSLGSERTTNIRLEEIESSTVDGKAVWLITLSNSLIEEGPLAPMRAVAAALGADAAREYKVFTVAKDSGDVLSMKIRLLATQ